MMAAGSKAGPPGVTLETMADSKLLRRYSAGPASASGRRGLEDQGRGRQVLQRRADRLEHGALALRTSPGRRLPGEAGERAQHIAGLQYAARERPQQVAALQQG